MSLPAPYSEVYLEGTGTRVEFPFGTNFKPIAANLVKCIVYLEDGNEIIPTYTVDMAVGSITISALTLPDGTILTAPPVGSTVRIYRDEPEAQNATASQLQAYTAKQLETTLDAIVAMIQEVSYTVDHKTVRLTEPQRDIALQELSDLVDGHLIYWDLDTRRLVVTNYPQQDVVRCVNGLFFRLRTDPDTHQPYLQWSVDNADWHSINIDATQALAQSAYDLADSAYDLASTTRGELNAHKADLANPHQTSMNKLTDVETQGLTAGQFLSYDGMKWKNVDYSAVVTWSGVLGDIYDNLSAKTALDAKVSIDGSSIMTGPLKMRATSSFQCAIAPFWDGVGFYKLNSDDSVTLIASIETPDGFVPWVTNTYNIGSSLKKWKNLYLAGKAYISTINNGYDLAVPAKSGTLATKEEVDLAANSGRMITDQGVWYAKMYAATVAPSAENGTNYADFSQVDGQGNPIIVTYNRVNGAWVQDQTITPPADYDGYVSITSKIWDITEQAGQQGGRILWNHQSKEFTPYPSIVSFEDAALTGTPTAPLPTSDSPNNQIATKEYVDNASPSGVYHPGLFAHEWDDHIRYDVQWLRADTFSWQDGGVYEAAYQHLLYDINHIQRTPVYMWSRSVSGHVYYVFTLSETPQVDDIAYIRKNDGTNLFYEPDQAITAVPDSTHITCGGYTYGYEHVIVNGIVAQKETIASADVIYYVSTDGHKICWDDQESNVASIYTATGVAWYYVLDKENQQFKLPRAKHNKYANTLSVVGNGSSIYVRSSGGTVGDTKISGWHQPGSSGYKYLTTETSSQTAASNHETVLLSTDPTKSGMIAQQEQDTDQYKYLYFYVGQFTQTALENTAGINASLFNNKADVDLGNVSSAGKARAVNWFMPDTTAGINIGSYATYTFDSDGWLVITTNSAGSVQYTSDLYIADTYSPFIYGCLNPNGAASSNFYPVQKGETVTKIYSAGNWRASFYPIKGAQ